MIHRLLLTLWYCFVTFPMVWGQMQVRQFVRITELAEMQSGERYIIGGLQTAGNTPVFALLSKEITSKGDAKPLLKGQEIADNLQADEELYQKCAWQVVIQDGRVQLQSPQGFLEVQKADATALTLRPKSQEGWQLTVEEGQFLFQQGARYLTLGADRKTNGSYTYTFRAYKGKGYGTVALQLYREVKPFGTVNGGASLPPTQTALGVTTAEGIVHLNGQFVDRSPLLLQNGSLAQEDSVLSLVATPITDSIFTLTTPNGVPSPLAEIDRWTIRNGYLCTLDATPRYLVALQNKIAVLTAEEVARSFAQPLSLTPLAPKPVTTITGRTLSISGGWSTQRLQELDTRGSLSIDFRQAVLPQHLPVTFAHALSPNSVVYLSQKQATYPEQWRLVVVNDTLVRSATLIDARPYGWASPFFAPAGMLSYEREAFPDGGWETICLPFTASIPSNFMVERLQERQGATLIFTATDSIEAGEAGILSYTGTPTSTKVHLSLTNRSGWVSMPATNGELHGTADSIFFQANSEAYLLESKGLYFLPAQSGSTLRPFRAYLPTSMAAQVAVLHQVTGITRITTTPIKTTSPKVYDLQGRPTSPQTRGLIIESGQKRWR